MREKFRFVFIIVEKWDLREKFRSVFYYWKKNMRFDNNNNKSIYVFIIVRRILDLKKNSDLFLLWKKRRDLIEKSRSFFYYCGKQKIW